MLKLLFRLVALRSKQVLDRSVSKHASDVIVEIIPKNIIGADAKMTSKNMTKALNGVMVHIRCDSTGQCLINDFRECWLSA